jgi:hypothetical protein
LKFVSSSSIVVDPPGATQPGPVDVTVANPGGTTKAVKPGGYTYLPNGAPNPSPEKLSITAIDPPEGPMKDGPHIKITGTGFTDKSVVTFDGLPGTGLKFESSSSITVVPPSAAKPGPAEVIVTNPGSPDKVAKSGGYTYKEA